MPWRLVGFIILFSVFLIFILSNLGNKCDISFINPEWTLKDVPVFLTVFSSFILGMLSAIPIIISMHLKRKKVQGSQSLKPQKEKGKKKDGGFNENDDPIDHDEVN
jgi:uncharacterized integral membrane protein